MKNSYSNRCKIYLRVRLNTQITVLQIIVILVKTCHKVKLKNKWKHLINIKRTLLRQKNKFNKLMKNKNMNLMTLKALVLK